MIARTGQAYVLVVGWAHGALCKTSGTNRMSSFDMQPDHVMCVLRRELHYDLRFDTRIYGWSPGVYNHDKGGKRWLTVEGLRRDLYKDLRRGVNLRGLFSYHLGYS
ncbi:hypothetical protein BC629DRAFT_1651863 [Irpex lacteus]|nr:hypothetical protein BC629DRAFT_1651863 [Irpex lacteus]